MAEKNILAVKAKAFLPSHNETLLCVVFIDMGLNQVLLYYPTAVVGDELMETSLDMSETLFVDFIFSVKDDYSVDTHVTEQIFGSIGTELKDKIVSTIIEKYKGKDFGAIEFYFKRLIDHSIQANDTKVEINIQRVSRGVIEVVNAIERKQSRTVAENSAIAEKYVGQNPKLVKSVLQDNIQDNSVICLTVSRHGAIVAALSFVFNELLESVISKTIVAGNSLPYDEFSTNNNLIDLYHRIEEFAASAQNTTVLAAKISESVDQVHSERLGLTLKNGDVKKIAALFQRALPADFANGAIEVLHEKMNSLVIDTVLSPTIIRSAGDKSDAATAEEAAPKETVVDCDLVLSPTKGVKVSQLQKGMHIFVIINGSTPVGRKVVNKLELMEENKVKPLSVVVESVKRDHAGNFIVMSRISSNLLAKAVEEEDIKVKTGDPIVIKEAKKSNKSLTIGLVVGIFVIVILSLAFWILF